MTRSGILFVIFLLPANLCAQTPDSPFGLKLTKVPDELYAHLPGLPKNRGILVEAVEPNSPAWRGGLRRFDVMVSLNAKPLVDAKSSEEKLRNLQRAPGTLTLFRAGREIVLAFDVNRKEMPSNNDGRTSKGLIKPGGPPAVTIQLQPMEDGNLHLVLAFYSANSGKMESLTYSGLLDDIERQIQADARDKHLPDRVQDLVEVALKRVRTINQTQK